MKIFILDDEIHTTRKGVITALTAAGHDLTIAISVEDAKAKYPTNQPYDFLLLDRDMEGKYEENPKHPNLGMRFVEWLVALPQIGEFDDPKVILHSVNQAGREEMKKALLDEGFRVKEFPFDAVGYPKALKEKPLEEVGA